MRALIPPAYLLCLALLTGGNALYTFLATPAVFRAFERALAGDIVASMMPSYFAWNLALWGIVFASGCLLLLERREGPARRAFWGRRLTLLLLAAGLASALAVELWLYPDILEVRGQVPSFAADAPVGEARALFRRLHGVSMGLNLVQLACSATLVVLFARRGEAMGSVREG